MKPEELELRLLSSLENAESLQACRDKGITIESFVVGAHAITYEYIERYVSENGGTIPSRADVSNLCDIELDDPGDLLGYIRRVRNDEIARDVSGILLEEGAKLELEPTQVVNRLVKKLGELRVQAKGRVAYFDKDAKLRIQRFDDARKQIEEGGVLGLPTGLKTFDLEGIGWQRGEFIVVMGALNVGKSWMIMKFCVEMYEKAQAKVLFVSPEMSTKDQAIRFDALLSTVQGNSIRASEILKGEANRAQYEAWLARISERSDFIAKDCSEEAGLITFEDIWDWCMEYTPDVLAIDGLHLIGSRDGGTSGWEMLKNGCAMLKSLAQQSEMVVLAAHQPDRSGIRNIFTPPRLDQTGYSIGVTQSADAVISMARARDATMERVFSVPKLRNRPPVVELRFLKWDPDNGVIEDMTDGRKGEF